MGDKLTPDQRKKLLSNLTGYDISPDMVRLSLVNMYLHGFPTPNIVEYDTLSSEDRWNETFDVILANPPFMTPKGGIRPHKKFGVQANKAEVLFTDYIAEHLNKNGRAGIVVPNGIVATTQTAYKQLRKLMVEDSLIAVISLPAGCFNPYSGVKTSILMLDKSLAKKTDNILFIKISNDGFDLGAQRREIEKNDLPLALEAFNAYKQSIAKNTAFDIEKHSSICLLVEKEKVLQNKDVVLSGDRYKDAVAVETDFPIIKLKELITIQSGFAFDSKLFNEDKGFPLIRIRDIKTNSTKTKYDGEPKNEFLVRNGDLIIGMDGEFNLVIWNGGDALLNQRVCRIVEYRNCLKEYIARMILKPLKDIEIETIAVTVKHISVKQIYEIEIPLPPLEVQEEIVREIEGYQKIIDGAKMVVENYKPTIKINPEWEMYSLDELCDFIDYRGKTPTKTESGIRLITAKNVRKGYIDIEPQEFIGIDDYDKVMTRGFPLKDDVLFTTEAPLGNVALLDLDEKISLAQRIILLRPKNKKALLSKYLVQILLDSSTQERIENYASGSTVLGIKQSNLRELKIAVPSFEEQSIIVERIENEKELVEANKLLISLFEQKIKDKINEVWGVREDAE
jgi:type I restriction enzyme M protein